jgi:hypothetical protein
MHAVLPAGAMIAAPTIRTERTAPRHRRCREHVAIRRIYASQMATGQTGPSGA